MNLIKIGKGLSLLPYFAEQSHTEKELIQIPVSDVDCYRYICLWPNCNVYETELAQKFQQFCINFNRKRQIVAFIGRHYLSGDRLT